MTRRFFFVLFLLLAFWIGASYLQFAVFRYVMIGLLSLLLLSFLHLRYARSRITKEEPNAPDEVTRGQNLLLHFPLQVNLRLVPVQIRVKAWYGLNELIEKPMKRQLQITAGPRELKTIVLQLEGRHCGPVEMGDIQIRIRDLFGLYWTSLRDTKARFSHEALVLPRYEAQSSVEELVRDLLEEGERKRQRVEERTDEVDTLRQYRPGDLMKKIHWKLSSRRGEFIVKQYEIPKEVRFLLLTEPTLPFAEEKDLIRRDLLLDVRDQMLEQMSGALFYLLTHQLSATLVTFHPEKMSQRSSQIEHLRSFRRQLALMPHEDLPPLSDQLAGESRTGYDFYILQTTWLNDDLVARAKDLTRDSLGVMLLLHYDEQLDQESTARARELTNAGVNVQFSAYSSGGREVEDA